MRSVVGGNPNTPPATLAALAADADRDVVAARPWVWSWPPIVPLGDSNDTAPGLVTDFDRSHPYALACIARCNDDSHDHPWPEVAVDMDRCGRFCEAPQPSPRDARGAFDATDRQS